LALVRFGSALPALLLLDVALTRLLCFQNGLSWLRGKR
jgi:hypothetical protein